MEINAPIVLDLVLGAVFIVSAVKGRKRGLSALIAAVCAFVLAFLVSKTAAPVISERLIDGIINPILEESIAAKLGDAASVSLSAFKSAVPESFFTLAKGAGEQLEQLIGAQSFKGMDYAGAASLITRNVLDPLISPTVRRLVFAVSAMVIFMVLKAMFKPLVALFRLPVLKQADSAAGLLVGALKGAVIVTAAAAFVSLAASLSGNGELLSIVRDSRVISFINNLIG